MANKFHINQETGRVNICRATVKDCPVGGESDHFATKEEAYAAREGRLNEEFSDSLAGTKKSSVPTSTGNTVNRPPKKGDPVAFPMKTRNGPLYVSGHIHRMTTRDGMRYAVVATDDYSPLELVDAERVKVRKPNSGALKYIEEGGVPYTSPNSIDMSDFDAEDMQMIDWATRGRDNKRNYDPVDELGVTREEYAEVWGAWRKKHGFEPTV